MDRRFIIENVLFAVGFVAISYYSFGIWDLFDFDQMRLWEDGTIYISSILSHGLIFLFILWVMRKQPNDSLWQTKVNSTHFWVFVGCMLFLSWLEYIMTGMTFRWPGQSPWYLLMIILIAPIVEEAVFRGFLLRKKSGIQHITINSAVFAIAHVRFYSHTNFTIKDIIAANELLSICFIFSASMIFGLSFRYSKGLLLPIFLHFLRNGIVIFYVYQE